MPVFQNWSHYILQWKKNRKCIKCIFHIKLKNDLNSKKNAPKLPGTCSVFCKVVSRSDKSYKVNKIKNLQFHYSKSYTYVYKHLKGLIRSNVRPRYNVAEELEPGAYFKTILKFRKKYYFLDNYPKVVKIDHILYTLCPF
jgi:hypothetical protein